MSTPLADSLCAHDDPVVAYRARKLLGGEPPRAPAMRRLRAAIGGSTMARRLLRPPRGKALHPYAKWQGPHWTLYSLAEIAYPPGDPAVTALRDRVLDWMLSPRFLRPPWTTIYADQPERPRRCGSMEGNAIWSQVLLDVVDPARTPLLVDRLLAFQWPDGGWNCDKRPAARASSVQETLLPLRALCLWGQVQGDARAQQAARRAADHLLARRLLFRRRDGALIQPAWGGPVDAIQYPIRFYDVLGALVVLAECGLVHDARCRDALDRLERKRLANGMFPVEWTNTRTVDHVESRGTFADWGPRGRTRGNPLVTIDALWVLRQAGRRHE